MHTIAQPWMWGAFLVFVIVMLAVDIAAMSGKSAQKMSIRQAIGWSLTWVSLALLFNAGLWLYLTQTVGPETARSVALEFLAGYVIEKSLSIDNIFIFLLIFSHFSVPVQYQRKVLLYGVLGAIVMRIGMILAGVWVVAQFSWIMYVFGAFLLITGMKMVWDADKEPDLAANPILRLARKLIPFTNDFRKDKFSVMEHGKRVYTPLLLVLILIEVSDVVFAVDSIPAIFAVTTDPFIVFTSNIFAIMGLRALYFLLADMADRFHYLKYGLAAVLMFVGGKMVMAKWWHVSTEMSLAVIGILILSSVMMSILKTSATVNQQTGK